MAHDPDCIFCKIIDGEIPSFKVREDDRTLAFMDINPTNPGHALVIPKFHAPDIHQVPGDWLAATIEATQAVAGAVERTLSPDGINLVQANGPGAAQSVQHLHFHVIPRAFDDGLAMNWGLVPGDMDAIGELAERIAANLV
jgi:histidine triad (HIT) family protein